jgi:O-antigen/teichoic acid export membrane protein
MPTIKASQAQEHPPTPTDLSEAELTPVPLDYSPDGTAEVQPIQPPPGTFSSTGLLARLARAVGVDRAIAFTVLARGWSAMAAAITIALILRYMTPVEQGYYSVINPLVNVQIIFELGFSFVILQTASHESAYLHIGKDGSITGPDRERGRLSSILQKALRWYSFAAVALLLVLLAGGRWFFIGVSSHSPQAVHWQGPWILAAVAASFTFQVDPIFSFLEGCGFVPDVARARLTQFVLGSLLAITALLLRHGLYAPGAMLMGQALAGGYAIYTHRRLLGNVLRHKPGIHQTSFSSDIWPLQWRMAVSWVSGYLTVPLFAPMLAHMSAWGPIEAGRMGVSLSIAAKIGDVAMAWMNTKAAPFGRMVALRQFRELDKRFFRALTQSTGLGSLGAVVVWSLAFVLARHGNHYAARFLSPVGLALMLFGFVANTAVSSMAIYLRAHKQEKFMLNSILGAVYTLPAAWFLGHRYGGAGIAASYAFGSLVIGLGYGTYTFLKWRRIWHTPAAEVAA